MTDFIKTRIVKSKNNIYDIAKYCLKDPAFCEHNDLICEHILNLSGYKTSKFKMTNGETFCKLYGEINKLREKINITYSNNGKVVANPKMSFKYLEIKEGSEFYNLCMTKGSLFLKSFLQFNNIKIKSISLPEFSRSKTGSSNSKKSFKSPFSFEKSKSK